MRKQFEETQAAMSGLHGEIGIRKLMQNSGIDVDRYGQSRSREELLADYEKKRQELSPSGNLVYPGFTHQHDVKPADEFSRPPSMDHCTPIHVLSLKHQNTHRGRLLRGTLVVQPAVFRGVQSLLEDELGNLVMVSFYNALPGVPQDRDSQWYAAERLFSQGRRLAILEPYFKLAADGNFLIRVDNPLEVVWLDTIGPSDADGWREEGVCHLAMHDYTAHFP